MRIDIWMKDGISDRHQSHDLDPDTKIEFKDEEGNTLCEFTVEELVGKTIECFRCAAQVSSRLEVAWIDLEERNDCPGGDGQGEVHEPEPV